MDIKETIKNTDQNITNIKKAFIFAGVNGAGKSTLYWDEVEKGNHLGMRINIDEIVSSLGDWRNQKDQSRAAKIALKLQKNYIENGENFNRETTLCGVSILQLFERLKANEFEIYLYYVGVDNVEIAKERVKLRVAKGGHDIDLALIDKRYWRSLENLYSVLPLCDYVYLYDNTKELNKVGEIIKGNIVDLSNTKWLNIINLNNKDIGKNDIER